MTALTPCTRLDCGTPAARALCGTCAPPLMVSGLPGSMVADPPTARLGLREDGDPMFAEVPPAQQQPSEMVLRLRAEAELARLGRELADTKARLARLGLREEMDGEFDEVVPAALVNRSQPEIGEISGCIPEPPHQTVLVLREDPAPLVPNYLPNTGLVLCEDIVAVKPAAARFIDPRPVVIPLSQQQPSEMVLRLRAEAELARLGRELADMRKHIAELVVVNDQFWNALVAERRAHDAVRDVLARHITTNAARSHSTPPAAFVDPDPPQATHKPLPLRAITQTRQRIGLMAP